MAIDPSYVGNVSDTFAANPAYETSKIYEIYGSAPSINLVGQIRELTEEERASWDEIKNATSYPE